MYLPLPDFWCEAKYFFFVEFHCELTRFLHHVSSINQNHNAFSNFQCFSKWSKNTETNTSEAMWMQSPSWFSQFSQNFIIVSPTFNSKTVFFFFQFNLWVLPKKVGFIKTPLSLFSQMSIVVVGPPKMSML